MKNLKKDVASLVALFNNRATESKKLNSLKHLDMRRNNLKIDGIFSLKESSKIKTLEKFRF